MIGLPEIAPVSPPHPVVRGLERGGVAVRPVKTGPFVRLTPLNGSTVPDDNRAAAPIAFFRRCRMEKTKTAAGSVV